MQETNLQKQDGDGVIGRLEYLKTPPPMITSNRMAARLAKCSETMTYVPQAYYTQSKKFFVGLPHTMPLGSWFTSGYCSVNAFYKA